MYNSVKRTDIRVDEEECKLYYRDFLVGVYRELEDGRWQLALPCQMDDAQNNQQKNTLQQFAVTYTVFSSREELFEFVFRPNNGLGNVYECKIMDEVLYCYFDLKTTNLNSRKKGEVNSYILAKSESGETYRLGI